MNRFRTAVEPLLEIVGDCIQIAGGVIFLYHLALIWINYPVGVRIYESNKWLLAFETVVIGVGLILFGINRLWGELRKLRAGKL